MIGSILLLALLTIVGIWGISSWLLDAKVFDRVNVGLVIPEEENNTKLIAKVVSGMDSVREICNIEYFTEEEAVAKVTENEIQAAIILTEGFYEDVDTGENTPVTILFSADNSLNQAVFEELLEDGVRLIQITEAAVYSMTDISKVYKIEMTRGEMQEYLSYLYINQAYQRENIFENTLLSSTGEVDVYEYYFVVAVIFLITIGGINFAFLYHRRNRAAEQKLKSYGIGPVYISLVKTFVMAFFCWCVMAGIYLMGCVICKGLDSSFLMYDHLVLPGLVPLAFAIAAFFHMFYALSDERNQSQSGLLLLCINAAMMICTGGILPVVYFPDIVQKVGKWLPMAFWMQYLREVLFGGMFWGAAGLEIIMGLIFLLAGVAGTWKNM